MRRTMVNNLTTKQLERWIIKWEREDAREKRLFGFLVPEASKDLAEYLSKRIAKRESLGLASSKGLRGKGCAG